jgi:hypothetical protein
MALHTLNFWEIAIDATQIGLCGLILLFLIRNRMKLKRLNLNAPSGEESKKFNTEFVVEAVRQQTELAFNHILESQFPTPKQRNRTPPIRSIVKLQACPIRV